MISLALSLSLSLSRFLSLSLAFSLSLSIYLSIYQSISIYPPHSLSFSTKVLAPGRIKRIIFITKCCGFFLHYGNTTKRVGTAAVLLTSLSN